jgi:enhancing lycopene biosynthesis protein 2
MLFCINSMCFASNVVAMFCKTLHHEINHITLEPDDKTGRNVRVEAARIARGNVLNISVSTFYLK